MKLLIVCIFQLIKRQFGMAGRVAGAASGASAQSTAVHVMLDLARHIRDKLPIKNREDFVELEAWVSDGDDETVCANCAQLKDYISRGAFGTQEKEYVYSALLRLFTKNFVHCCMSWAGAKGSKEFTLKTSAVWELLNDVVNGKFPNFQKNMAVHFNNFHKDVGKAAACAPIRGSDDVRRRAGGHNEPASPDHTSVASLFDSSVEEEHN